MSDTQRFTRPGTPPRLLRCPRCAAEIDSRSSMCEYCGALVYVTGRGYALGLDGQVCFSCGDVNRWSAEGTHCRGCGRPFATTCPGCGEGVPLSGRSCHRCGLSVEDFAVERARAAVARHREQREAERSSALFLRWQAFVGFLLLVAAMILGPLEPRARRPLLALGAATGLTALVPAVLIRSAARTRGRRPLE